MSTSDRTNTKHMLPAEQQQTAHCYTSTADPLGICQLQAEKSLRSDISKAGRVAGSTDPVSVHADGLSLQIDINMFLKAS